MPFSISLTNEGALVTTRYYGVLNADDLLQSYRQRYTDAEQIKKYRLLIADYSEVSRVDTDGLDVTVLAQMVVSASKINPKVSLVSIMPDDLQFGLGRMWQGYTLDSNWKIGIVRTKAEADHWLEEHRVMSEPKD